MIGYIYIILLCILIWRTLILLKQAESPSQEPLRVFRMYLLPLVVLSIISGITAVLTAPFSSPEAAPPNSPIGLRQSYVLISHLTYAAAVAAIVFLSLSHRHRGKRSQVTWSLFVTFAVVTMIVATTIISANYDKLVFGSYFSWDPQHTARIIFFIAAGLAFLFTTLRTFRYRTLPDTKIYWFEPLLIITGILAKVIGTVTGMNWDPLPWL